MAAAALSAEASAALLNGGTGISDALYSDAILKEIRLIISHALEEDIGNGDLSSLSTIGPDVQATARFLAKGNGTVAGLRVADMVCAAVDVRLKCVWTAKDGDTVTYGTYFGDVSGPARSLLMAERLCLNIMQRMSGIATATAAMMREVPADSKTRILDTRKTVPGLRVLDKIAHRLGGGTSHRWGLYDMVMIKDNHIKAAGGVTQAVDNVRAYLASRTPSLVGVVGVELETATLDEVRAAVALLDADADAGRPPRITRIMLDNMVKIPDLEAMKQRQLDAVDVSMVVDALAIINGKTEAEVSGNVTRDTVGAIAGTNVDYISSGALTHSVMCLDISLKITSLE